MKKFSSGRVQVWGSSFKDPWDSFVSKAINLLLEIVPEELIEGDSVSSRHCPSLFCVVHLSQNELRIGLCSAC